MTTVTKITCMQNHNHKNFEDSCEWARMRIYAIMLPSSDSQSLIMRQKFVLAGVTAVDLPCSCW